MYRTASRLGRFAAHNALAVVALTVSLGGTAYAAATIGSAEIVNDSVKSIDVKNDGLTGADVRDGAITGADLKDGGVSGTDLEDGSVGGADLAATPWQEVRPGAIDNCSTGATGEFCESFDVLAGEPHRWSNWGGSYQGARFRRDATGEVTLQGLVERTPSNDEKRIFVLPGGYRPSGWLIFTVGCGSWEAPTDATGVVEVRSNGEVAWRGGDACDVDNWVSLSGISFPTAEPQP